MSAASDSSSACVICDVLPSAEAEPDEDLTKRIIIVILVIATGQ
jgi:hypothetical protein